MRNKITWFLFLFLGFLIVILNHPVNSKFIFNFMREIRLIMKKHSKYTEDNHWHLIEKKHEKRF
jgi:hypothetical protein